MTTGCFQQLTLWDLGSQQVTVTFQGGRIVSDAGLLGMRKLDKELGVLSVLAERLPDPRAQDFVLHSRETLLTQQVYQILAGYPDCNDAQALRKDPLFHTLLDLPAEEDAKPLASGSTLARFAQAFTRRQAELPWEERPVLLEVAAAQNQRLKILNAYLPELFIRTRRQRPAYIILDIDASDDPTHGQQVLSFYHGHYEQHQYFPLFVFDGKTGFPLAAWLRPGTVHASCGAIDTLKAIIEPMRRAWPNLTILVRGDGGFAVPAVYEFCEAEGLLYAFGYSTNSALVERTDAIAADLETYHHFYGERDPHVQRFEVFEDYQAGEWTRPRRIVAKVEINRHGMNRRFVVTNLSGHPQGIYQGFYVQRGAVPEQPIGELKNGLLADRLSFHRFRANAWKLLEHVMAFALVILHREATAPIPEVAQAQVNTLRTKLWKVGALVKTSVRRIWFHFSESWPYQELWQRVYASLLEFVAQIRHNQAGSPATPVTVSLLLL
jgi:Transposase DDE domain group 1